MGPDLSRKFPESRLFEIRYALFSIVENREGLLAEYEFVTEVGLPFHSHPQCLQSGTPSIELARSECIGV